MAVSVSGAYLVAGSGWDDDHGLESGAAYVYHWPEFEPPGIPKPLAPPDGSVTFTGAVTFTWEARFGGPPTSYNLELDGAVLTTTATLWTTTLSAGPHAWRIQAFNGAGSSGYCEPWSLTVRRRIYLPIVWRSP
jgi:hypothetical protein